MKRLFDLFALCIVVALLANWAAGVTDKTSFFGVITTRQGNIVKLTNMRIGKDRASAVIKQIVVYEKPKDYAKPTPITGTANKEIALTVDPETDLYKKRIDLNEIQDVSIPSPEVIWTFQKQKQYRKLEYIEVVLDKPGSSEAYLIDRNVKLFGDAVQDKPVDPEQKFPEKGAEESEFPLPAIKQVHVEGYYIKQDNGNVTQMPVCTVPAGANP